MLLFDGTTPTIGATLSPSGAYDVSEGVIDSKYITWIKTKEYTIPYGYNVGDLFDLALDEAGLRSVGSQSNYVSTIYAPEYCGGYALSEFTNGLRSGWMYIVNGYHPGVGLNHCYLEDGDEVIWHYINDYSYEVSDWFKDDPDYPNLGDETTWDPFLKTHDVDPEDLDDSHICGEPEEVTEGGIKYEITRCTVCGEELDRQEIVPASSEEISEAEKLYEEAAKIDTSKYPAENARKIEECMAELKKILEKDTVSKYNLKAAKEALVEAIKKADDKAKADEAARKAEKERKLKAAIRKAKAAKTTVKVKALTKHRAKVTWKKVSGVTGYKVYRAAKKSGKYKLIKTIKKAGTLKYTDKKLKKGKKYYYKVRTYTKIDGKTYLGKWSKIKSIKAK